VILFKDRLYMATSNRKKFDEIKKYLSTHEINIQILKTDLIEIQNDSLDEIAKSSILSIKDNSHNNVFVEDSGLFIDSLDGFPGPYSSFAFRTIGCEGILRLLNSCENRRAEFKSSIAYRDSLGNIMIFHGGVKGIIGNKSVGLDGFGFDPIFIPDDSKISFGLMSMEEKNRISHRCKAIEHFLNWYLDN